MVNGLSPLRSGTMTDGQTWIVAGGLHGAADSGSGGRGGHSRSASGPVPVSPIGPTSPRQAFFPAGLTTGSEKQFDTTTDATKGQADPPYALLPAPKGRASALDHRGDHGGAALRAEVGPATRQLAA